MQKKHKDDKNDGVFVANFSVFDQLSDGFYAIDTKWRYIYVNKEGTRLAQVTKKEMIGKRPQDLFADAHSADFGQALKAVMKDKRPRSVEAYYPRHNKWYENSLFPIPEGVGILARDITQRKQAEEDQRRLAAIVSSSDDAIVSKNLNSIVNSWNIAAEKMFGYTAEEMIGKSIRMIIPDELQKEEDEILATLRKGKRIDHFQTTRVAKDGKRITVSVTISPIKNSSGQIIGASKIARDITTSKQVETNLKFLAQASKELSTSLEYEKTLSNVAHLAVPHIADWCSIEILDTTGTLQQVAIAHKVPKNVKWAKAHRKKTPPDMQAKTGLPKVLRTGKTEIYPYIDDALLVQSAKDEKELTLLRKLHLTSIIITPLFADKKPIGGITFITTESRKRYTESDVEMAEELANRASLAIENARLYKEMQKELAQRKKLEKQKDEFIGVASHELKTPVTSIKSFAQILQYKFKKEGKEKEAALLGKLDAQIDKLTALIGDLLDVTKIQAGRIAFNEDQFLFDDLVAEIVEEMQRTTDKHTLHLVGKTKKKIVGDRERIGQVIINLISNAVKYSPHTKEIIVSSSAERRTVQLCVQDFGVGIAQDKQERVFERFFRVSGPDKETYPGLGLGLYISSEIIKRMQGKIWVESIEGQGSKFSFRLPIKLKKIEQNGKASNESAEIEIKHE